MSNDISNTENTTETPDPETDEGTTIGLEQDSNALEIEDAEKEDDDGR